jgi:hypothetical protein
LAHRAQLSILTGNYFHRLFKDSSVRECLLLLALAVPSLGQAQSNAYPDLLADWQRNRSAVLAYIDAMPDSATGFRPTPGVRTFAQQFDHIVTTNLEVAAVALRGAFQEAKPAQLTHPVSIFGQKPQPAIRLAALSFEHAVWPLGQVVPYLRLNGVTPPEYQMPF